MTKCFHVLETVLYHTQRTRETKLLKRWHKSRLGNVIRGLHWAVYMSHSLEKQTPFWSPFPSCLQTLTLYVAVIERVGFVPPPLVLGASLWRYSDVTEPKSKRKKI